MCAAFNRPQLQNQHGENQIRRYTHQTLSIEHNGISAKIQSNGRVFLSCVSKDQSDAEQGEVIMDEIEIPASLVFKLGQLLRATRTVEYVAIGQIKPGDVTTDPERE